MDLLELEPGLRVRYQNLSVNELATLEELTIIELRGSFALACDDLGIKYTIAMRDIPFLENVSKRVTGSQLVPTNKYMQYAYESSNLDKNTKTLIDNIPRAKLKLIDDPDVHRIMQSAQRTAERVAKWPAWKRGDAPLPFVPENIKSQYVTLLQDIYNYLVRRPFEKSSTEDIRNDLNIDSKRWKALAGHGRKSLIHKIATVKYENNSYIWNAKRN